MDEKDPRRKRFYHGGNSGLKVGEYILPPKDTGKDNMGGTNPLHRKDRDIAGAMWFASASRSPTVYEVIPEGQLENDPDHKREGVSFACPKAKIVGLHNIPEYVVKRNQAQMRSLAARSENDR